MSILWSLTTNLNCLELDRVRKLSLRDNTKNVESVVLSILLDCCCSTYRCRVEESLNVRWESVLVYRNTEVSNVRTRLAYNLRRILSCCKLCSIILCLLHESSLVTSRSLYTNSNILDVACLVILLETWLKLIVLSLEVSIRNLYVLILD